MKKQILFFLSLVMLHFASCNSVQQNDKKTNYKKPPATQGEDYFYLSHSYPYNKIDYEAQKNAAKSFKNSFSTIIAIASACA